MNSSYISEELVIKNQSIDQFLIEAFQDLPIQQPEKYIGINQLENYEQLPFCIVADRRKFQLNEQFVKSLKNQRYSNYKTALVNLKKPQQLVDEKNDNFYVLNQTLSQQCGSQSIILFMENPLEHKALFNMNNYYQTLNVWMTYSVFKSDSGEVKGIQLLSVYKRVFDFLDINDFFKYNKQFLQGPFNSVFVITGLLQLCKYYALSIPQYLTFKSLSEEMKDNLLYYPFNENRKQTSQVYKRVPYQTLHSLAQNYQIKNMLDLNRKRQFFMKSNTTITQKMGIFYRDNMISHTDMRRALQYEQIIYLPQSHSLNLLEIKLMEQKFETGKYSRDELPLCININSRNNIQNERYKKVLDSVTAQNYSNYRIVFIDDLSDDETMSATQVYLKETLKFPRGRVSYIKNKVHTYATYNIINAAFNYCPNDSIQVLVDGDDQLIGKQIFKLINAEYHKNNLWVMYTFYKSDKYDEGISIPFKNQYLRGFFGGRKLIHYFGPTRTFKVSLVKKLPLREHLNQFGQFFDTMYDTALEYPLFELSGKNHSKFVNYTSYLYFSGYGGNDDSNIFKKIRRIALNIYVSMRQPLQQLQKLDDLTQNEQVFKILKAGEGKKYEQLD